MRAPTRISKLGAMAVTALESETTMSTSTIRRCRETLRVRRDRGMLVSTTAKAKTDTSSPICDSPTPSSLLISGRRPVGSISAVTERNTAAARTSRPPRGRDVRNPGRDDGDGGSERLSHGERTNQTNERRRTEVASRQPDEGGIGRVGRCHTMSTQTSGTDDDVVHARGRTISVGHPLV